MTQAALDRAFWTHQHMLGNDPVTYRDLMTNLGYSQQEAQRGLALLKRAGLIKPAGKVKLEAVNRSVMSYVVRRKKYDAKAVQRALIQQPFCPYCGRKGGSLV